MVSSIRRGTKISAQFSFTVQKKMQVMKKNISGKLIALMMLVVVMISSCEKNTDTGTSTADRDKFIGSWNCTTTGPSTGTRTFTLTIMASNSASDQIIMKNFDQAGTNTSIFANVSGNDLSIVSTQVNGDLYQGIGSISNGTISFTFTVDDGQTIENRTGTASK
jgi:hypothetical protein